MSGQNNHNLNAIEFRNVSLAFGDNVVLNNLSFNVRYGESKVVMGGSGTGKSTILRLVLGLLKPDTGRILIEGEDITEYSEEEMMGIRRKIGMVFQEGALFDSLPVYDNVAYRLREQHVSESEIESTVLRMLRFVDLEDAVEKMPNELSGGMRRRVGIARALVGNPKIILYDEPTAGLDPITARTICELALKLRDLEDVSSIFVTHRLQDIEVLANEYVVRDDKGNLVFEHEGDRLCLINTRFIMLKDGDIIFNGTDEELRNSEDPYIHRFFQDVNAKHLSTS
ncbi:MAG: ATP-binding cassette domain-containing protein [Acidobacteria bacterium]|nr:ATP-binding cassette domain-containing protein [Acidobacteriota bacterium]